MRMWHAFCMWNVMNNVKKEWVERKVIQENFTPVLPIAHFQERGYTDIYPVAKQELCYVCYPLPDVSQFCLFIKNNKKKGLLVDKKKNFFPIKRRSLAHLNSKNKTFKCCFVFKFINYATNSGQIPHSVMDYRVMSIIDTKKRYSRWPRLLDTHYSAKGRARGMKMCLKQVCFFYSLTDLPYSAIQRHLSAHSTN